MLEEETALRQKLVELVHAAGIYGLREESLEEAFVSGTVDPHLKEIGIDSLSEMELCIAIEREFGVEIVPADISKLDTLMGLTRRIARLQDVG